MKEGDPQKTIDKATVVVMEKETDDLLNLIEESLDAAEGGDASVIEEYARRIQRETRRLSGED